MGERIDVEDLVGTQEIAARLGVRRPQVIHDWRRRHADFPKPLTRVSGVWVWSWRQVAAWAERTGRA